jgi:hypothetical protein
MRRKTLRRDPQLPGSEAMDSMVKTDSIHTIEKDNIRPPPHYHPETGPQIITSDTARQGPRGTRVLVVLVCGLIAIGVAWVLVDFFSYR